MLIITECVYYLLEVLMENVTVKGKKQNYYNSASTIGSLYDSASSATI